MNKAIWSEPILFEHSRGKDHTACPLHDVIEDVVYVLSLQHQDDLTAFERELSAGLAEVGVPFLFIQPEDPGYEDGRKRAMKMVKDTFDQGPAFHPDHPRRF